MEELKLQLAPAAPKRADPGPGRVGARVTRASKRRRFVGVFKPISASSFHFSFFLSSFLSELSVLFLCSDRHRRGRHREPPFAAAFRRRLPASFPTCKVITVKPSSSTFTPSERICEIVVRSSRKRTRTIRLLPLRSEDPTVGSP
ncbi:hypothetical protein GQ457_02G043510 [Hibiscus cannabinus]